MPFEPLAAGGPVPLPTTTDKAAFLSQIIETQNDVAAVELEPNTVMQMIVERTQRLTNAEGAALEFLEEEELVYRSASGVLAPHVGLRVRVEASMSASCITNGELLYCEDTAADPRANGQLCAALGIRSMIMMPLAHHGVCIGVLKVISSRPRAFDDQSRQGLQLMAGLLAAALNNASEFEVKKQLLAERTDALAALRESEERFRSAFDNAVIGKALVALDGRWVQVNRALSRMLGYTDTELRSRDFQSITHPGDLDADLDQVRNLIAGRIPNYHMVKRYFHKQGHVVWAMLSVSLVRDPDGKPLYFISQIQDITERHRAEAALRASEEEYRATFELAGVGKVQTDVRNGRFLRVNGKFCEITGYTPAELQQLTFSDITHPDDRTLSSDHLAILAQGTQCDVAFEKRYIRKDGQTIWVSVNSTVLRDADGRRSRAVATILDITQRKRMQCLDEDRRRILEMVVKDSPLGEVLGLLTDAVQRQIPDCYAAAMVLDDGKLELFGSSISAPWQKALRHRLVSLAANLAADMWDDPDRCGVTFLQSDAAWKHLRDVAAQEHLKACWTFPIQATDESPVGLLTLFSPLERRPTAAETEMLEAASKLATLCIEHHHTSRRLSHLVRHDVLTGLPNRLMFEDRLCQALAAARRNKTAVGLFVLDIDKFKTINDTLGHHAGDHLLQQFSQRLRNRLRQSDTMARLGGDEFVVVLPDVRTTAEMNTVAEKLIQCLVEPFDLGSAGSVRATTSIGIAIYPDSGEDPLSLQKKADAALYRAKAHGRNRFSY